MNWFKRPEELSSTTKELLAAQPLNSEITVTALHAGYRFDIPPVRLHVIVNRLLGGAFILLLAFLHAADLVRNRNAGVLWSLALGAAGCLVGGYLLLSVMDDLSTSTKISIDSGVLQISIQRRRSETKRQWSVCEIVGVSLVHVGLMRRTGQPRVALEIRVAEGVPFRFCHRHEYWELHWLERLLGQIVREQCRRRLLAALSVFPGT